MVLAGFATESKDLASFHSHSGVDFDDMPPDAQPRASASEPPSPQMSAKRNAMTGSLIVRTDAAACAGIDLENIRPLKCVLVGDGAVGKTSLVVSYTTNGYPLQYVPTAFDDYSVMVQVDGEPLCLQICDTAGQDDFDTLRPLCYPETNVFLMCFSIVSPTSFHNIIEKWLPEIRSHNRKTPIILVGTQCDLRTDVNVLIDLSKSKENPITEEEAQQLADRVQAVSYIECSALTQHNLKDVFDAAILTGLKLTTPPKSKGNIIRRLSKKENYSVKYVPEKKKTRSKKKPSIWTKLCCIPVAYDPE